MAIKSWIIAGAALVAGVGMGSARAAPITYVGDYGSDMTLTITTDGAMGDINGHILNYDIKSSIFSDGDLDYSNSDFFFMDIFGGDGPSITASPQGLSYDFGGSVYTINFEGEITANENENLFIEGDGFYLVDSPDGSGGTLIDESGPTIIATPLTSAAPEPSTWALTIAGLASIGLGLRRAKMRRGFSFSRAVSA